MGRKDKVFELAKGFRGRAKNCYRITINRVEKALQYQVFTTALELPEQAATMRSSPLLVTTTILLSLCGMSTQNGMHSPVASSSPLTTDEPHSTDPHVHYLTFDAGSIATGGRRSVSSDHCGSSASTPQPASTMSPILK